nr:DUF5134 domain-containing protein [Jiangella mangrovi]
MARTAAAVAFLAVAGYSALRFTWTVTRPGRPHSRTGRTTAGVPDLSHALMGVAMALMVGPAGPEVPELLGIAVFVLLGAWFAARLRRDGLLGRTAGPSRLGALAERDGGSGHGGYHLHHLVGCAAMVLMYVTGHGALAPGRPTASAAGSAGSTDAGAPGLEAAAPTGLDAGHAALGAHAAVPALAALCWLFGLYFLVAATSLGFRVGESAVRVTHHVTAPLTPSAHPTAHPRARTSSRSAPVARLLASPAGTCASEVVLSAGMAVLFFSAL